MEFEFVKKTEYVLNNVTENIEFVSYSLICLIAPFLLGHPQFLVGVIVNAGLVLAALNLKDYKLLPVILLPSIGVLSRGLVFGPFTMFLIYMIPFIWIGNAILVFAMKEFFLNRKMNRFLALGIGAVLKTAFLFGCAFIFVNVGVLPAIFLTSMGLLQLYTAAVGGVLALGIQYGKKSIAY